MYPVVVGESSSSVPEVVIIGNQIPLEVEPNVEVEAVPVQEDDNLNI